MGRRKRKIVLNPEESGFKPRMGRIPIPKPPVNFRDKSKYSRKEKHQKGMGESPSLFV